MTAPVLNARLAAILAEHAPWEPTVALIEQRMTELEANPFQVARLTLILEHELKRIADLVPSRRELNEVTERLARLEATQDLTPALDASLVKGKIEQRIAKVEQRIEDIRAELAS